MSYDLETLKQVELKLAALVVQDQAYLPLFLRIEREIETLKENEQAIGRAKGLLAAYRSR